METLEFLNAVKAGGDKKTIYEKYVKAAAKKQVNLPDGIRKKFDAISVQEKPAWDKAPWNDAVKSLLAMIRLQPGFDEIP